MTAVFFFFLDNIKHHYSVGFDNSHLLLKFIQGVKRR